MLALFLRAHGGAWMAAVYVPLIVFGFAWAIWLITGGIRELTRLRRATGKPARSATSVSRITTLAGPAQGLLEP